MSPLHHNRLYRRFTTAYTCDAYTATPGQVERAVVHDESCRSATPPHATPELRLEAFYWPEVHSPEVFDPSIGQVLQHGARQIAEKPVKKFAIGVQ